MDSIDAVFQAVRAKLVANTTLIAYVPASQIGVANQQAKPTYPYIAIALDGACGDDYKEAVSGNVRITVYITVATAPNGRTDYGLKRVYEQIKATLHEQEESFARTNIVIDTMYETYRSEMIADLAIPNLYFISARYGYVAHTKL